MINKITDRSTFKTKLSIIMHDQDVTTIQRSWKTTVVQKNKFLSQKKDNFDQLAVAELVMMSHKSSPVH